MLDVGRPGFLVVKSDNSSRKPTWHLDMVVVESDRFPPVYFVAGGGAGKGKGEEEAKVWRHLMMP